MIAVYLAEPCKMCADAHIWPAEREKYIKNTADKEVARLRFGAWKLLETAAFERFGLKFDTLGFSVGKDGKWSCDKFFFSLSHTRGLAVAALSDFPVGVDAESISAFAQRCRRSENFASSLRERLGLGLCGERELLREWTARESAFKRGGYDCVFAARCDPSRLLWAAFGDYEICVCGEDVPGARFYTAHEENGAYGLGAEISPDGIFRLP